MQIRKVSIERFRGLEHLELDLTQRNVLLGPNNAGKSTVLEALDLLLHPGFGRPRPAPNELDFYLRDPSAGFRVEAVLSELPGTFRAEVADHLEGWRCRDRKVVPEPDGDGIEPVVRVQVSCSPDFELAHEFAKEESAGARFSPRLRREISWVFDGRTRDPARQLAFYQGGLLDRLFSGVDLNPALTQLRTALGQGAAAVNDADAVSHVLAELGGDLRELGVLETGQRPSFEAGAVSHRELLQTLRMVLPVSPGVPIPLERQGRGVQRLLLVSLLIRLARASGMPLIGAFEEPEEALEPIRQAQLAELLTQLPNHGGQVLLVTHSPEIVRAFAADDVIVLPQPPRRGGAITLRTISPASKQGYERRLDGPVVRALFAPVPLLVEGPGDRALMTVFWRALADQGQVRPMSHLGLDVINCEGAPMQPQMAALLHEAGKTVLAWAEQDTPDVLTRLRDEGHCAGLLIHDPRPGRQNLEGALAFSCSVEMLTKALTAVAEDRGYDWDAQRADLLSRCEEDDSRSIVRAATDLPGLLRDLPDQPMRAIVVSALGAKKVAPFEIKGFRQARVFAKAVVAAGGVPAAFTRAIQQVANWLTGGCIPPGLEAMINASHDA